VTDAQWEKIRPLLPKRAKRRAVAGLDLTVLIDMWQVVE
jgi:hypothetical protein